MKKTPREIDAIVAKKVMGWAYARTRMQGTQAIGILPGGNPMIDDYANVPLYSTDIADAWQVLDHIPNRDALIDYSRLLGCRVILIDTEMEEPDVVAIARDAPPAICLAALKACGVDVEAELTHPDR